MLHPRFREKALEGTDNVLWTDFTAQHHENRTAIRMEDEISGVSVRSVLLQFLMQAHQLVPGERCVVLAFDHHLLLITDEIESPSESPAFRHPDVREHLLERSLAVVFERVSLGPPRCVSHFHLLRWQSQSVTTHSPSRWNRSSCPHRRQSLIRHPPYLQRAHPSGLSEI